MDEKYARFWDAVLAVFFLLVLISPLFIVKAVDFGVLDWNETEYSYDLSDYELVDTLTTEDVDFYYHPTYVETCCASQHVTYRKTDLSWGTLEFVGSDLTNDTMYFYSPPLTDFGAYVKYSFVFTDYDVSYFLENSIRLVHFSWVRDNATGVGSDYQKNGIGFYANGTSHNAGSFFYYRDRSNDSRYQFLDHYAFVSMADLLAFSASGNYPLAFAAFFDDFYDTGAPVQVWLWVKLYTLTTSSESILVRAGIVRNQYEELGFYLCWYGVFIILCGLHATNIVDWKVIFSKITALCRFIGRALKWLGGKLADGSGYVKDKWQERGG